MLKNIYVCYDSKTKIFSAPFYAIRDEQATRDFAYAANDPQTDICRHSSDFALYKLGSYDDETGLITSNPPVFMCSAFTLKQSVTTEVQS